MSAPFPFRVETVAETVSTNDDLKRRAANGEPEGLVLVADCQTGGRGRLGRAFHSPAGCGLYASVLLRPHISLSDMNRITCYSAVVLFRAIQAVSTGRIGIKWVNDIYRNGKKVCGILTESATLADGMTSYVVVGIGVNIIPPPGGFPDDIAAVASSVFDDSFAYGERRDALLTSVLEGMSGYAAALQSAHFLDEYRSAFMLQNTPVIVQVGGVARNATALRVDAQGRLHVRYDDGTDACLIAGDVSIRIR